MNYPNESADEAARRVAAELFNGIDPDAEMSRDDTPEPAADFSDSAVNARLHRAAQEKIAEIAKSRKGQKQAESKQRRGESQKSQESQGGTADWDKAAAVQHARKLLSALLTQRECTEYPAHALGPLAEACTLIAEHGQVQPALAGQSLLGAASLLTQGLANVETLTGPRPLSLFLLTLGDSGDGKTTAERVAMAPVHSWQRKAAADFANDLALYEQAKAAQKKGDKPPEQPRQPYRIVSDSTIEGLRRDLAAGIASQGSFSDEAAAILCGYGMSQDHRAKTASTYSRLWDNGLLSVSRSGAPRIERYGVRVATHWMVQPMPAAEAIGDPTLSALGFWPRFLAAWPAPTEPRKHREFAPEKLEGVVRFWDRCIDLLALPVADDCTDAPAITLTSEARTLLGAAFERFEVQGRRGHLAGVKPFALRAVEQACRVAGVLEAFAGKTTVSKKAAEGALALVAHSLDQWRALIEQGQATPGGDHALKLYGWLIEQPEWAAKLPMILHTGPACVRSRDKRDSALDLLTGLGLTEVSGGLVLALNPGAAT